MGFIREMRESDAPRVMEIYNMGIESGISTFTAECPSYGEWDGNHHKVCLYVYETDGEVVGWVVVAPTSKRERYCGVVEVSLYIDEKYFHRGIGTALLTHLIEKAPEFGFWCLYSAILETNPRSVALHEKCGFRRIGYRERIAKDRNGKWQNTIIFEKRL